MKTIARYQTIDGHIPDSPNPSFVILDDGKPVGNMTIDDIEDAALLGIKLRDLLAAGKVGWMDSIGFQHELGCAMGGNTIFPDKDECMEHHKCIIDSAPIEIGECTAMQVRVLDESALAEVLSDSNRRTPVGSAADH